MSGEIEVRAELKGTREAIKRLRKIGADVGKVKKRAAEAGGEVIRRAADRMAPGPHVVMGTEAKGDRVRVDIGPDDEHWYYKFFETGVGRHDIGPKNSSVLRFIDEGELVFTRLVKDHPGMPAQPFLRPALDENVKQAVEAVAGEIRKALP
jgi:HK97 gp10 family phage protein